MPGSDIKTAKAQQAPFVVSARQRQKGAYAVEFAFVFIVFFVVLYGIITYGLIFAAQQSLNFAAESGARAGLQWQEGNMADSLEARAERALAVAADHTAWVDQMAGNNKLKIAVCGGNPVDVLSNSNGASKALCKITDPNKLEVVIHYSYKPGVDGGAPLVPYILPSPIMNVAIPTALQGRATVDLGIAQDRS